MANNSSEAASSGAPSNMQKYTLAQVKEHGSVRDCWVALDGGVYDVTKFLEDHPGGPEIILEHAGKDGTTDFEDIGHSKSAREMLRKYQIGTLVEGSGTRTGKLNDASGMPPAPGAPKSTGGATAAGGAAGAGAPFVPQASAGGNIIWYIIPALVLVAGLAWQLYGDKFMGHKQ